MRIHLWLVLLAIAAPIVGLLIIFGSDEVIKSIPTDAAFWVENTIVWIVFAVFVGLVSSLFNSWLERQRRASYENWVVEVYKTVGSVPEVREIYWQDMQKFAHSEFELFKYIRSTFSPKSLQTGSLEEAKQQEWLDMPEIGPDGSPPEGRPKRIQIFFDKATPYVEAKQPK